MERRTFDTELRAGPSKIVGFIPYGSRSRDLGGFTEVIAPGAFAETLRKRERVISLWQHKPEWPLGNTETGTLRLKDSSAGLRVTIDPGTTTWAKDALTAVARGDVQGLSFGFTIRDGGEKWLKSGVRELRSIRLHEISPVTWGAYPKACVQARGKGEKDVIIKSKSTEQRVEEILKKQGYFNSDRDSLPLKQRGAMYQKILRAGQHPNADLALIRATGLSSGTGSEGGFLVGEAAMQAILDSDQGSKLRPMATKFRINQGNRLPIPLYDESSRVRGNHKGGISIGKIAEGTAIPSTKPKFRQVSYDPKKLGALFYASEELFLDVTNLATYLESSFGNALGWEIDFQILRGNGTNECLGILNSSALHVVSKQGGQSGSTIVTQNVLDMFECLLAPCKDRAVWLASETVFQQLAKLELSVGSGGSAAPLLQYTPEGHYMLGLKVLYMEQLPALGQQGDLVLADLSEYGLCDKGEPDGTISSHLRFFQGEEVYRLIYRVDGSPLQSQTLTAADGAGTRSAFIALEERS